MQNINKGGRLSSRPPGNSIVLVQVEELFHLNLVGLTVDVDNVNTLGSSDTGSVNHHTIGNHYTIEIAYGYSDVLSEAS